MKSIVTSILLTTIILATSWAILRPGFFFTHDYVHGARIVEISNGLLDGHFPVRWSENFGFGYGMPLFEFYAPLPYYFGAILLLAGIPLLLSVKAVFLVSNIATAIGAYYFGKSLYGRIGGVITAAAISLAPYRAVNLYIRGAVSEAWGIAAAVWVLFFTVQFFRQEKGSKIGLILSLVALFLSHNLMTLIFVPFAVLFAAGYIWLYAAEGKTVWRKTTAGFVQLLHLGKWYLLAGGLAAFYMVPALLEKDFTQVNTAVVGGYFDFHLHFVYLRQFLDASWGYGGSDWGPDDKISFFFGYAQTVGLVAVGLVAAATIVKKVRQRSKTSLSTKRLLFTLLLLLLFGLAVLLTTEKTLVLWEASELLSYIQFPWRFLSIGLILLGTLLPIGLIAIRSRARRWLVALLLFVALLLNTGYFKPESFTVDEDKLYYSDKNRIRTDMSSVLVDYIPVQMNNSLEPATEVADCHGCDELSVMVGRVHENLVGVSTTQQAQVIFNTAYFPGWYAEVDGKQREIQVTEDGLISVSVPEKSKTVGIKFGSTPVRYWSDLTSLASLVLLFTVSLYEKQKKD